MNIDEGFSAVVARPREVTASEWRETETAPAMVLLRGRARGCTVGLILEGLRHRGLK